MPTVPPSPPSEQEGGGSFVVRFGSGVGLSAFAAAVAVVPAALRVSSTGVSLQLAWAALTAAAVVPMALLVFVLRRARVGLRFFRHKDDAASRGMGLALWLLISFVVFVIFGAILRATTHHHALAGVTFSVVATVLSLAVGAFAGRVAQIVAARSPRVRLALFAVAGALFLAVLAGGAIRFGGVDEGPRAMFVDVLALVMAALFASRPAFANRRALAIIGPPVAATVLALGISALRGSSGLPDAVVERAPAFAPAAKVLTGR
jgi:hypothetical protein